MHSFKHILRIFSIKDFNNTFLITIYSFEVFLITRQYYARLLYLEVW